MSARQRRRKQNQRRGRSDWQRRRLIGAGGLAAGATLAISGVAQAAPQTYTVGTNADSSSGGACLTPSNNDCSLREALTLANSNAGIDTIVFNSNLSGQTITLSTGHLSISEGLNLVGPGPSQLTIDANYSSRIFDISPSPPDDPVSISGLTLTNGSVGGASGGDIYNEDNPLTISNAVISGGYAGNETGGGVYSHGGPLTIDHSTISGNHAYRGGGVASGTGEVTITDSEVSNNYADGYQANNGADGYGGGVWSDGADLTITRSTLYDNTAAYDGGGIYAVDGSGSSVTITNSTIADNHAANDDAGGVYDDGSNNSLTVIDSTVTGNTAATDGGGLKATGIGTRVIENSIVSGNTASPSDADTYDLETGGYFDTAFSLIGVPGGYVNETVPGSNLIGVDPQLGGLGNNGGPTQTELPADTSPVVNKGSAFGLNSDQRGFCRPIVFTGVPNSTAAGADGSDMGAVELQNGAGAPCPTPPSNPPVAGPTGQRAAALNKCKKKHKNALKNKKAHDALTPQVKKNLNKKFKKCKRRANQLPV